MRDKKLSIYPIKELLPELIARLPELEWKVTHLPPLLFRQNIPKGLFRLSQELTGILCINEIKEDLQLLAEQNNTPIAYYLAEQISRKISTLVGVCQISSRLKKSAVPAVFGIKMLSTRQQWLQSLEDDITSLTQQQIALAKNLVHTKPNLDSSAILNLKAELGEVERRLTLAQETLKKSIV